MHVWGCDALFEKWALATHERPVAQIAGYAQQHQITETAVRRIISVYEHFSLYIARIYVVTTISWLLFKFLMIYSWPDKAL